MSRIRAANPYHFFSLLIVVLGVLVWAPQTLASTSPITDRTSVWGDWQSVDFGPFEYSSGGTPTWTASGLPDNTTVNFGTNPGSTATATIEQTAGTRGPDVLRDSDDKVIASDIDITATLGSDSETFPVTFTVNPRPAAITGSFEVADRDYDGSDTAAISSTNNTLALQTYDPNVDLLSGVIGSDVTLAAVGTFDSPSAGTQTVNLGSSTLSGAEAANYDLRFTGAPTTTAEITAKELSFVFQSVSKSYDGSDSATVVLPTLQGVEGSDTVSVTGSPVWKFVDEDVGPGKTLTIDSGSYSLAGSDAGNYSIPTPTLTGSITQRTLTVVAAATTKEYDGTDTAVLTVSSDDRVSGDSITVSVADGTFAQSTPGNSIAVTPGAVSLSGDDAANYTASLQSGITGRINPKTVTVTGSFTVSTKTYDDDVSASGDASSLALDGVVGTETVSLDVVDLEYADADAGSHTVSIDSATLTGSDGGNYVLSLAGAPTATGTIDPLPRTLTVSNTNKVYDGTTDATPTLGLTTLGSDSVSVSGTATYQDANVDTGISIAITGISLGGTDSGNYSVDPTETATGDITTKTLTVTGITGDARVYDGTDSATVSGTESLVGVVSADSGSSPRVTLDTSGRQFSFNNENAASNKAITASGYSLSGVSATNYSLTQPSGLTATISRATLTASITADDKTYDRSETATVMPSLSGKIPSDDVSLATISSSNRTFDSRNQGTNKTVTVKNLSLTGTDAGNYQLASTTVTATATITPKQVTVSGLFKTYDGSPTGTARFNSPSGRLSGDTFEVEVEATFTSKNAGTYTGGVTFDPNGVVEIDNTEGNYVLVTPTSPANGTIFTKDVDIRGIAAVDKVYDSKDAATVTGTPTLSGLVGSEQLTISPAPPFIFKTNVGGANTGGNVCDSCLVISDYTISDGPNAELASNYDLFQPRLRAAITPRQLTIGGSFTVSDKVYDRNIAVANSDVSGLVLNGVQVSDSDDVELGTVNLAFDEGVAGARTVSITSNTSFTTDPTTLAGNYTLSVTSAPTASATITPKPITASVSAPNKTYDASNAVSATLSLSGVISGDSGGVTVSGTSSFTDKNVETGKTVTASSLTLSGARAGNYSLTSTTATTTASIVKKPITIDPDSVSADDKVYDQNTAATVTIAPGGLTLVGDETVDTVSVVNQTRTHTFTNRNVGNNRSVTATGYAVEGADSDNYSLTQPSFLSADITAKSVTASVSATNKTYDAANSVSATLSRSGVISGDTVTVSGTSSFADKNVGDGKTVTASSLSLGGTHGTNYSLTSTTATTTADIDPFRLTVTPSASDRQYDGTTTASASCAINEIGSDDVDIDCQNAVFASKDLSGTSTSPQPLTVTISSVSLSGTDAGNYLLPLDTDNSSEKTQYTTTATILPRELKASGFTPDDKDYDGTTSATFSIGSLVLGPVLNGGVGEVSGDDVTFTNPAGQFDSRNAGTQSVRLQTWTLSGDESNNYTVDVSASLTQAEIRPINLTVTMSAANKTYNGNTNASVTAQIDDSGLVPGDTTANISVNTPTATFDTKNVGNQKTVTVDPQTVTFSGSLADNYEPVFTNPTANITARALSWTVSATSRVYDATTNVTYTLTDNRVSGDTFTVDEGTGSFSTASRGTAKAVSVSGIGISGGDAGNYSVPTTAQGSANITPRAIAVTGTFAASDKTYDRSRTASVSDASGLMLGNVVATDAPGLTISTTSALFSTANAGTNRDVTLTAVTISGTNSTNYTVNVSGVTKAQATISPRPVTPVVVVADRFWDGTTNATVTSITATQLSGDSLTLSSTGATFDSADQGTNKTVTITGVTSSNSNYSVPSTVTTTADITGTPVTVIATASNKTYDGTRSASVTLSETDSTPGDDLTLSFSNASFAQSDAGDGITVTVSGVTLGGQDATAYVLVSSTVTTTADIDEIALSVTASDKVYDGTDSASISLSGVLPGDSVNFATSPQASFDDPVGPGRAKDVGVNKAVTVSGIALSGSDQANYSINNTESASADITRRLLSPLFTPTAPVTEPTSVVPVGDTDDRVVGDILTINYTASEALRRGNQLVLVVSGLSLSGADSGNYRIVDPSETVLRTFAVPRRQAPNRNAPTLPPEEPVVRSAPAIPSPVQARPAEAPREEPQEVGEQTAPLTPATTRAPSQTFPGWSPPSSRTATIDSGQGPVPRNDDSPPTVEDILSVPVARIGEAPIEGFASGAELVVETMGARTVASLTISAEDAGNPNSVREKFAQALSVAGGESGFPVSSVQVLNASAGAEQALSVVERDSLDQALSWVGLPPVARGPGVSDGSPAALVVWDLDGFVPGSTVFLVATSEPALIAWGQAGPEGQATLTGTVQSDTFAAGSHKLRIIGTTATETGLSAGAISANLSDLVGSAVGNYDSDTRMAVGVRGANPDGSDHVALRFIDLSVPTQTTPVLWWLLLIPLLGVLSALVVRRSKKTVSGTERSGFALGTVTLGLPAVLVGLVSGPEILVLSGVVAALAAAAVAWISLPRSQRGDYQVTPPSPMPVT